MTRLKRCYVQGKIRFPTYYAAYRVHQMLNRKNFHLGGCVYRCQHCHDYHITHYDEPIKPDELIYVKKRLSKKELRSERRKKKLIVKPPKYDMIMPKLTEEEFKNVFESREFIPYRHKLNLCILLADIIDSWLVDIVPYMQQRTGYFRFLDKKMFKKAVMELKDAKEITKRLTTYMYNDVSSDTDQACDDSDFLRDVLWLINDRIDLENDEYAKQRIITYLKKCLPSRYGMTGTIGEKQK